LAVVTISVDWHAGHVEGVTTGADDVEEDDVGSKRFMGPPGKCFGEG
jgi:hypothetical protein